MPSARSFLQVRDVVAGATGLEIGGPSAMFARNGLLPIYPIAGRIDNCNFASNTLWERDASDGSPYRFADDREPGRQWVAEATTLPHVLTGTYDFVISCHTLEHTANPLQALIEWRRVLKPGGMLVLVVPHRDGTFDHRRPITTLAHLRDDLQSEREESDLSHLEEVLRLHDLTRDPWSTALSFGGRMRSNFAHRSMHHHVFDTSLAIAVCEAAGYNVCIVEALRHDHIIVVAHPADVEVRPFTDVVHSPFPSDRHGQRTS